MLVPPEPVLRKLAERIGGMQVDSAAREVEVEILQAQLKEKDEQIQELKQEVAELEEELDRGGSGASEEPEPDDDEEFEGSPEEVRGGRSKGGSSGKKKGTKSK